MQMRPTKTLGLAIVATCLIAAAPAYSQTATSSRTRAHVETLASPKMEGRLTGSPGEKLAADYLIAELKKMGARPLPGTTDFRMPFVFTAGSKDGGTKITFLRQPQEAVASTKPVEGSANISALSFSGSAQATGSVVFAG